jgi:hypothetical protein
MILDTMDVHYERQPKEHLYRRFETRTKTVHPISTDIFAPVESKTVERATVSTGHYRVAGYKESPDEVAHVTKDRTEKYGQAVFLKKVTF